MNRTLNINFAVMAVIAAAGLLAMQLAQRHSSEWEERQFSERVNLALRQTAHRLLADAGDHSSAIPPVRQEEKNLWLVQLEHNFDYDSLPGVLKEAFASHRIEGEYNVAVLNCANNDLMLGYTASLIAAGKEIPCGGREQATGCYNLQVTFPALAATPFRENWVWIFLTFACMALLVYSAYGVFNFLKKKGLAKQTERTKGDISTEEPHPEEPAGGQIILRFGHSTLNVENQKLVSGGIEKDLTYRETKLLQLLGRNVNQLLERDLILKSVWEDEGIMVGRSVDVFVSRLRKILKDDETLKIVNVHGVGYRLEVRGHS